MTNSERMLSIIRIMKRMRRKLEIMELDRKAQHDAMCYDIQELLGLMDMLERALKQDPRSEDRDD